MPVKIIAETLTSAASLWQSQGQNLNLSRVIFSAGERCPIDVPESGMAVA
jgi:hypothetical protein